ncbi:hypothetical protein [Maribacter sp. 2307ULW6-5]|uniref:hypothetical protein n=1 Tax=Maribacter sp. 2307ULW6-5 TaxID=3386275 RepID=UPI0039BD5878
MATPIIDADSNKKMKTITKRLVEQNKRLAIILTCATALLFVPLLGMALTDEIHWKTLDFIVAGALLYGSGLTLEFILRKIKTKRNRLLLILGLFLVLVLVWAELAVGVFNTVFAGS